MNDIVQFPFDEIRYVPIRGVETMKNIPFLVFLFQFLNNTNGTTSQG